jgi:hypothetical protein
VRVHWWAFKQLGEIDELVEDHAGQPAAEAIKEIESGLLEAAGSNETSQ